MFCDSSGSGPPASEVSDQYSMLEHAYNAAKNAFHVDQDGTLQGGNATLNLMEIFPRHCPLAKMTLPQKFCVQRLDRLIAGYLMEVIATHQDPEQCRKSTSAFAKTLVRVATYLAKLIASLLRPVLYHPHMIQFDDDTESLLTSQCWLRSVYEELLHAASRFNMSPAAPFCQLIEVKKGSSKMRMDSTSSAFKQQKLEETRDKPWERKKTASQRVSKAKA